MHLPALGQALGQALMHETAEVKKENKSLEKKRVGTTQQIAGL